MPPPPATLAARVDAARRALATRGAPPLLVSHLVHLRYLTGVPASAGLALLGADELVLVADARYLEAVQEAARALPATTVVAVPRGGSYEEAVGDIVKRRGLDTIAVEADHLTLARADALRRAAGAALHLTPLTGVLEGLRAVKDAWELATLREAGRRLASAAACILHTVSAGHTERQVAWDIEVALHEAGFDRLAFEPIVASGPNAARPHHRAGDRRLAPGDLVVVDFGGVLDGYAVDMTRTVAIDPVSDDARRWLRAVAAAQRAALAAGGPGVLPSAVDAAARASLAHDGLAEAFVHGTGHGLGLEVHERPTIGPRGDHDGPLAEGMVYTVEPGVYLPGRGGVRLEDDVVVTASGVECLTGTPACEAHER